MLKCSITLVNVDREYDFPQTIIIPPKLKAYYLRNVCGYRRVGMHIYLAVPNLTYQTMKTDVLENKCTPLHPYKYPIISKSQKFLYDDAGLFTCYGLIDESNTLYGSVSKITPCNVAK